MNQKLIDDMSKALNENNLGKARSILVNSLLAYEDQETIEMLNKMAMENGVFEEDRGGHKSHRNEETGADNKEKFQIKTVFQSVKKLDTKKKAAAAATFGLAALAFGAKLLLNKKSDKK
ncbi:hypothetical protein [Clostridium thermarum]|uniref:hypothetical protein n=1 Tax=Clostridium thermarum TaxID=1716543 RepID=UPI00111D4381|nr:hypothetical protein [Clostridium thermarum]